MKITSILVLTSVFLLGCVNQNGLGLNGNSASNSTGMDGFGAQWGQNGAQSTMNSDDLAATAGQRGIYGVTYLSEDISDTVLFAVDQSVLDDTSRGILTRQAKFLREVPGQIIIEGHADEQGTREYNVALGAQRAGSVRRYLINMGIPENRISVVSYGKERPLEVCSVEECWRKNRRAVTVVR